MNVTPDESSFVAQCDARVAFHPQGVIYQVHVGDYMGQNYGHVTQVTSSEVDLVELVPNGSGGWMERDASVALGDK